MCKTICSTQMTMNCHNNDQGSCDFLHRFLLPYTYVNLLPEMRGNEV